jgi:uncharacterized membrane protein
MLVPIPILCFVGTLITDIAYWRTAEMMWADFSAWLGSIGVLMSILGAIFGSRVWTSAGLSSEMAKF